MTIGLILAVFVAFAFVAFVIVTTRKRMAALQQYPVGEVQPSQESVERLGIDEMAVRIAETTRYSETEIERVLRLELKFAERQATEYGSFAAAHDAGALEAEASVIAAGADVSVEVVEQVREAWQKYSRNGVILTAL